MTNKSNNDDIKTEITYLQPDLGFSHFFFFILNFGDLYFSFRLSVCPSISYRFALLSLFFVCLSFRTQLSFLFLMPGRHTDTHR